jgi:hypothetical protein
MSRVGRDYLQVGYFTEILFKKRGVRFIAVSNNIDSDIADSAEFAPFLNLMSEWYSRDCSRKIKTVIHARGNSGIPLTNKPIYGYTKNFADNLWVIDAPAAAIVRRVFQMTIGGIGAYKIARILSDERVEKPSYHTANPEVKRKISNPYSWCGGTISAMLSKPEYLGHTVNFRTFKASFKDKNHKRNSRENWRIFRDTHEPIIDQSTFDTVQKLRKTARRVNKATGESNPLTGLMYCRECGAKMYNFCTGNSDNYDCSTYNNSRKRSPSEAICTCHYIGTATIRELVLDSIRKICAYVTASQAEFVQKIEARTAFRQARDTDSYRRLIAKNTARISELETIFRSLYEDKNLGNIDADLFDEMNAEYCEEQTALKARNAEMRAELRAFAANRDNVCGFIELVKRYTAPELLELSTPLLNEFIHKIIVRQAVRNAHGERVQRVDIVFNLIGTLDTPNIGDKPTQAEQEKSQKS